jgi:hypothetical protein
MSGFRANLLQSVPQEGTRFPVAADWVSEWQYTRGAALWIASMQWPATSAVGTLWIEMNVGKDLPITFEPDFNTIRLVLPAGTSGTYGAWPNVAAAAGNAAVFIKNPAPAMRAGYTYGGAGTGGSGIKLHCIQRA